MGDFFASRVFVCNKKIARSGKRVVVISVSMTPALSLKGRRGTTCPVNPCGKRVRGKRLRIPVERKFIAQTAPEPQRLAEYHELSQSQACPA